MKAVSVLIVEDEKLIRDSLRRRLARESFQVQEAETGAQARELLKTNTFDVALLDYRLPDTDGLTVLKEIRALSPQTSVIVITAFSSVNIAVEAIRLGAADFVTKPFNLDEIIIDIQKAIEAQQLREQVTRIHSLEGQKNSLDALVGQSPPIRELKELIRSIAASPGTTVLLQGTSGSGKDLVAKIIHYNSPRAAQPFVNITCTAITESLLESELFGHERGAFTDARELKKGLFEIADGGTIFLDEIGDMPALLQAKLLRFLEERAFRRVGGTKDLTVDVRIISATNRDIRELISRGLFRADLFYRLNSISLTMPPLADRPEDIGLLAEHFVRQFNREFRRNVQGVTAEALARLKTGQWPGNVRELRNVIERAMLLGKGEFIAAGDLNLEPAGRPAVAGPTAGPVSLLGPDGVDLQEVERRLVVEAMERTGGNQTRAARLLRISRDQLRYRLEKFGLLEHSPGRADGRLP
jgi:DNA-binding NtrC family response regulator